MGKESFSFGSGYAICSKRLRNDNVRPFPYPTKKREPNAACESNKQMPRPRGRHAQTSGVSMKRFPLAVLVSIFAAAPAALAQTGAPIEEKSIPATDSTPVTSPGTDSSGSSQTQSSSGAGNDGAVTGGGTSGSASGAAPTTSGEAAGNVSTPGMSGAGDGSGTSSGSSGSSASSGASGPEDATGTSGSSSDNLRWERLGSTGGATGTGESIGTTDDSEPAGGTSGSGGDSGNSNSGSAGTGHGSTGASPDPAGAAGGRTTGQDAEREPAATPLPGSGR